MDELVRMVAEKTGIGEDAARQAVNVVLGFLKERLPSQISGLLDTAASGKDASDQASDLLKGVGGLFGR